MSCEDALNFDPVTGYNPVVVINDKYTFRLIDFFFDQVTQST